jgi:hypothetical protein
VVKITTDVTLRAISALHNTSLGFECHLGRLVVCDGAVLRVVALTCSEAECEKQAGAMHVSRHMNHSISPQRIGARYSISVPSPSPEQIPFLNVGVRSLHGGCICEGSYVVLSSAACKPFSIDHFFDGTDDAFSQRHIRDMGQDVEEFEAFTWRLIKWKSLQRRITSDKFRCGGHTW